MRVALSGLTMAEYFRDVKNQDVLLFIDNIFRFTQAGSEVSALLGRMPSAVGYQPTLATEMGALQEGDATIPARLELLNEQMEALRAQKAQLEDTMNRLAYKIERYEDALRTGKLVWGTEEEH